jgi:PAS domain S-box-containing protein
MQPLTLREKFLSRVPAVDIYRSIFENALEGIFQTTPNGQYLNVNPALAKMYGYDSPEDLIERLTRIDNQLYVDPLRRDAFVLAMEVHGIVRAFESEIHRKDGTRIWISENARAVRDASGKTDYYEGMVEDITERKEAEEALRLFRALIGQSNDAIEVIAPETGRFLDVNGWAWKRLGYTREELLSMTMTDVSVGVHCLEDIVRETQQAGYKVVEDRRRRKDGSTFPIEANIQYINLDRGYLVAVVRDITERKRAEDRIAEQAAFLDKARDGIIARDLEGKVLFWNEGAERIFGWKREEMLGENVSAILYANLDKFKEINRLALGQGEWTGEVQHLTKTGSEIVTECRCTLIRDAEGQPKSVLAIYTDITERKLIEAQFLRAQRMESIGTLAGGIAHDLNNILTPIMLSIDSLKMVSDNPRASGILETISISARRGADIVRQVLSFARGVEGERVEIQPRHLVKDLEHIIKDTFPKNIRLVFSIAHNTWTITGDPTQIHQVLLNLSVNARDAMPDGGTLTINVENAVLDEHYASMHLEAKPGRYVAISVADSGHGIPSALVDKIFEPFFTTKQLSNGTGLGLSTVMAIVKSHQGLINVYSEENKGTTFTVYLPAIENSPDTQTARSGKVSLPRGRGETILIIDDEASILTITSQTLQAFGYRVLTAPDGAHGVAVYLEHKNDIALVLTDMMMPVMDGPATIHALKSINPAIKIIAASGLSANGNTVKPQSEGGPHFLLKPYTSGTLLKVLRTVLDSR